MSLPSATRSEREEMKQVRKSNSARKGVQCMKSLLSVSFALALVMSLLAFAQEPTKSGAMKQETTKAAKHRPGVPGHLIHPPPVPFHVLHSPSSSYSHAKNSPTRHAESVTHLS